MARKSIQSVLKRQRERKKAEKAEIKRRKRLQRKHEAELNPGSAPEACTLDAEGNVVPIDELTPDAGDEGAKDGGKEAN